MSGRDIPAELPDPVRAFLRSLESDLIDEDEVPESWIESMVDEPNTGPVRPEIERLPDLMLH